MLSGAAESQNQKVVAGGDRSRSRFSYILLSMPSLSQRKEIDRFC